VLTLLHSFHENILCVNKYNYERKFISLFVCSLSIFVLKFEVEGLVLS